MPRITFARILAPLALIAAGIAVVVIVKDETHHDNKPAQTTTVTTASHRQATRRRPRTYVVRQGDNLSSIASRVGVPPATREPLNPGLAPQTLHVGQRLRLTR